MKLLKQAMAVLGTVVVIAIIAALVTPKTAHALVATFVQVVNTPTSAVPTMQAPAAAQLYQSICFGTFSGGGFAASCSFPSVPAGKTLFVESFSVISETKNGDPYTVSLFDNNTTFTYQGGYNLPMSQQPPVNGFDIFTGLGGRTAFGPGTNPNCYAVPNTAAATGTIDCQISGYLAPAN